LEQRHRAAGKVFWELRGREMCESEQRFAFFIVASRPAHVWICYILFDDKDCSDRLTVPVSPHYRNTLKSYHMR
jgi:hypothetical protein